MLEGFQSQLEFTVVTKVTIGRFRRVGQLLSGPGKHHAFHLGSLLQHGGLDHPQITHPETEDIPPGKLEPQFHRRVGAAAFQRLHPGTRPKDPQRRPQERRRGDQFQGQPGGHSQVVAHQSRDRGGLAVVQEEVQTRLVGGLHARHADSVPAKVGFAGAPGKGQLDGPVDPARLAGAAHLRVQVGRGQGGGGLQGRAGTPHRGEQGRQQARHPWEAPRPTLVQVHPRTASFGVMPSGPVFLVSDVHLGAVPRETEEAFRRWLLHVKESGSRLIINGDLFDFWFEYRRVVFSRHVRVLALLADLVESGLPVLVMGGNHDWWGGDFLKREIGVDFRQEPARIRVRSRSVLIAHGDGLGAGDLGYRILRLVLRGRPTRWLFRWIHPDLGARLADWVSGTGDQLDSGAAPANEGRTAFLSGWAAARLKQDPSLDIVALGHGHEPMLNEVAPGRFYVNSGDWVRHRSYVTIDDSGRPKLHEWDG